jgi:hypothetical protein
VAAPLATARTEHASLIGVEDAVLAAVTARVPGLLFAVPSQAPAAVLAADVSDRSAAAGTVALLLTHDQQ